ncbi:MAG: AMP-binding protein, partial [Enterobacteriaceae bacterium]
MAKLTEWPWQQWAREKPQALALRSEQQHINWSDLCREVEALAGGFQQQGVAQGALVALQGKNSQPMLLAFLALLQCGARVLPLNPQLAPKQRRQLLAQTGVGFVWCLQQEEWPSQLSELVSRRAPLQHAVAWHPGRPATLTLTSGSSGLPKAAVHSIDAHLASASAVLSRLPFEEQDCWLLSLPLLHVSGQGILWRWLYRGAILSVADQLPLQQALIGSTHASLVPVQLTRLLAQPVDEALSALKCVMLGGSAIPVSLTEQARARGIDCWCGYGMTEMASTVCLKQADGQPGVGTLLPGNDMRIVDNEIWLRGPSLALGYWQQTGMSQLCDSEGWL